MLSNHCNARWTVAGLLGATLLLSAGTALAQNVINLSAGPSNATLSDGSIVPMWGYSCGAVPTTGSAATCAALNPGAAGGWSPVVITVPTGSSLQINLTNNLTFPVSGSANNVVPTSLVIVGQIGGGLGSVSGTCTGSVQTTGATCVPSPTHAPYSTTWAVAGNSTGPQMTPPGQNSRVQSFATEVATGTTSSLLWNNLSPGTYLIESGTHPSIQGPMGLYGILVVTSAPTSTSGTETAAGTAYPGVSYDAEVPVLLSEIDATQNLAVSTAVGTSGFNENNVVILRNTMTDVTINAGGTGYKVNDTFSANGGGGIGATAQVTSVDGTGAITGMSVTNAGAGYTSPPSLTLTSASSGTGANLVAVLSLAGDMCVSSTGTPAGTACYPPAVNYSPRYYLMNGVAFNRANAAASLFPTSPANIAASPSSGSTVGGQVLVRLVNAGLRMHVPAIVGSLTGSSAVSGFSLIAEDGNPLPGIARVQSEVFMAAGKTYDVLINGPTSANSSALAIYDRQLSLSGNASNRDAGMLAYLGINGGTLPAGVAAATAVANPDSYSAVLPCATAPCAAVVVSDPSKGVIANDVNVYGVKVTTGPSEGTLALNSNGTFTYTPNAGWTSPDKFTYCANGGSTVCAQVTMAADSLENASQITVGAASFNSNVATYLSVAPPGILASAHDSKGFPLTVAGATLPAVATALTGPGTGTVTIDPNGGFSAQVSAPGTYTFSYQARNSQGVVSAGTGTVTLTFPTGSGLAVNLIDGKTGQPFTDNTGSDYRWIIEEDRTFYVNPNCAQNPPPAGCTGATGSTQGLNGISPTYGTNFHTSDMPFVAQGCTGPLSCESGQTVYDANPTSGTYGQHVPAVCDVGNGVCRADTTGVGHVAVLPSQVHLDPTKRYYISILPGDAANPFSVAYTGSPCASTTPTSSCAVGYGMGGSPVAAGASTVTVPIQASPYPPGELSVFVFEDDFPLNGEVDSGGGVDVLAPLEPGLGGFQIHLWDAMGGNGDFTGQMTYDMFNMPLTNSLDGTTDPATGLNACPISQQGIGAKGASSGNGGITGMIITCPKYEGDGKQQVLSPLAGQAVIRNLMPGRFGVIATPGADRIARGEEWHQTNTLDGQKAHDSFIRIGEPEYFQEYGPANYHVTIGFANPAIINSRLASVCSGSDVYLPGQGSCNYSISGKVTTERMSRTPDERLYSSGSHDSFYWTQCYVSFGDPDGEDFAFTKCKDDGTFSISGLPKGSWRVTVFDQWNDMLVDGLSTPVGLGVTSTNNTCPGSGTSGNNCDVGDIASNQWQANIYTKTFIDSNRDGVAESTESGLPLIPVSVRYRDGSLANNLSTDFTGTANFNETFPLFNWYVVESDVTRYKNTGTHAVYDAGGPADQSASCGVAGYPPCGTSTIGKNLANTVEQVSLPNDLRVPGSVYCDNADCTGFSVNPAATGAGTTNKGPSCSMSTTSGTVTCSSTVSTGRIDSPWMGGTEGYQGFSGQNNFLEFGKEPYAAGENGGIRGHVVYASTRPFDDPAMDVQLQWEPLIPHVTVNLYQEGTAADGTTTLTLVDSTQTSSWDDWAQGFRTDASGNPIKAADGNYITNMSCPGQSTSDLFFFTLFNQPMYLDLYNNVQHGTNGTVTPLAYNAQFKCYDGMHNWNQLQPAPYDGMYAFPSVIGYDPATGKPVGTHCNICTANTAADKSDLYYGLPMLPPGKYVVEVVPPAGYELVKEEDKNILIGDDFIAPAAQPEFTTLGDIFIMPDQASLASAYNATNPQNETTGLGTTAIGGQVPAYPVEPVWPCVGQSRVVPDYISLFPQTKQVSPFAGAQRNLCDRKEVTLSDQTATTAKFYLYTSTHKAAKFTGVITDDFTSEFDPFSPQFGEKFSPPNVPVAIKDWNGTEIARVYSDQWGNYDGMTYSTWEVNPPNPTGYSPTMMVMCMNDPGTGATPDPLFNPLYSQFCYELPFMPGQTQYLDTPVVPTAAYVGAGYNNPDCAYPDATPAVASVTGDVIPNSSVKGPWVSKAGNTLTLNALGNTSVVNYGYSGPAASSDPFNKKTVSRHYGFLAQCTTPTAGSQTCNTTSSVTIGGVAAKILTWSDTQITVQVPTGVAQCAVQQQAQYGGKTAYCGELSIVAGNGKSSIDAVTVTIGGKTPTVVASTAPLTPTSPGAIQKAIDAAAPGDLIIVPAGQYQEMLLMWKPVRLQGVGAASSVINANTQPAGKLDPWRAMVSCLFGLTRQGTPIGQGGNQFDATGEFSCPGRATGGTFSFVGGDTWNYFSQVMTRTTQEPQIDRLPLEGIVGWDTTTNGNLAQLLQEPTLMGAYEGAAITVLSKGVNTRGLLGYFGSGSEATFPTGSTVLTTNNCSTSKKDATNPYPSNFLCNPSSIDGLSLVDSSQGGGGLFVHAWGHNLQIANNRVYNNIGTLSGGINIGQGESPDAYLAGTVNDTDPGSCQSSEVTNRQLPYCFDMYVNVHNNLVTANTSIGDELFSGTPAGAGGVSFCTGADYYAFNYNWVCGNLSTGDGGGLSHIGFSYNGDIEHNWILFNQSTNPTIQTNGGGIIVMGAAPDGFNAAGQECGSTVADADCTPGLPDGTGPDLVINANLILGNSAASGSGGGIRLQSVNGTELANFPRRPNLWNDVTLTNNIIANNVAGWDGGGISMQDALRVSVVNNTVVANDTTASAGPLFDTIGAPLASAPNPGSATTTSATTSQPQAAGLVTMANSPQLLSSLVGANGRTTKLTCPDNNPNCQAVSNPYLANDLFWQNRAFYIGVGALSSAYQQNLVTIYDAVFKNGSSGAAIAPTTPVAPVSQTSTGQCVSGSAYWDIGVRGDLGPGSHDSGFTLSPTYSALTNAAEAGTGTNDLTATNPQLTSEYCNGARTPPEAASGLQGWWKLAALGWQVPPGIADATVPNPIFNLSSSATVDEGNNWVNINWGPLSLSNPVTKTTLGNWAPLAGSPVIDYVARGSAAASAAPSTDFFGNPRPDVKKSNIDVGAIEYQAPTIAIGSVLPTSLTFGSTVDGSSSAAQTITLTNSGGAALTGITVTVSGPFATSPNSCGTTLAAGSSCTISIVFLPTTSTTAGTVTGSVSITGSVAIANSPVSLTGTAAAQMVSATLTPTSQAFGSTTRGTRGATFPFTLTNTGNVTLTGIGNGASSSTQFVITGASTCGSNGGSTTLAPGANCVIRVQFRPASGDAHGSTVTATLTETDSAGTQTSAPLTGTVP